VIRVRRPDLSLLAEVALPARSPNIAWTLPGLVKYYVLSFIHVGSRRVEIPGITRHPAEEWMAQVARSVTTEGVSFLSGVMSPLRDRDTKFSENFRQLMSPGGVQSLVRPARSPNPNAFVERWIRTVKYECLDKLIFFERASVEWALNACVEHYHAERNHQRIGNAIPRCRGRRTVWGRRRAESCGGDRSAEYLASVSGGSAEYLDHTASED
jgi:putative transposase